MSFGCFRVLCALCGNLGLTVLWRVRRVGSGLSGGGPGGRVALLLPLGGGRLGLGVCPGRVGRVGGSHRRDVRCDVRDELDRFSRELRGRSGHGYGAFLVIVRWCFRYNAFAKLVRSISFFFGACVWHGSCVVGEILFR